MWVKRQTAIPYQLLSCEEKKMSRCFLLTNSPIPWPDVPLNPHWKFHISQIQSGPQIWLSTHKLAELTPNFRVRKFEFMQSLSERLLVNHRDNIAPFCSCPHSGITFSLEVERRGEKGEMVVKVCAGKNPTWARSDLSCLFIIRVLVFGMRLLSSPPAAFSIWI